MKYLVEKIDAIMERCTDMGMDEHAGNGIFVSAAS